MKVIEIKKSKLIGLSHNSLHQFSPTFEELNFDDLISRVVAA